MPLKYIRDQALIYAANPVFKMGDEEGEGCVKLNQMGALGSLQTKPLGMHAEALWPVLWWGG